MKVAKIKGLSTILHQTKNNVAPRYLGTRESYGNFLDHKPSRDITNLLLT
ncbi:MAG: hypothetical protein LBH96_01075 [Candidatus Peribacteria bacterium]|jgi:hypothetical protein|nr:hypothetical protein [Candidatus Peribacteria bacterium]